MTDYKDKYIKLLNELDGQDDQWKERLQLLYTQVLRILASQRGRSEGLDEAIRLLPDYIDPEQMPIDKLRYACDQMGTLQQGSEPAPEGDRDLMVFIEALQLQAAERQEFNKLFIHLDNARSAEERPVILQDFASRLAAMLAPASTAVVDDLTLAREATLHLLEQLPAALHEQMDSSALRSEVTAAASPEALLNLLDRFQTSLGAVLEDRDQQIEELSGFLSIVVRRLDVLRQHLSEQEDQRRLSGEQRGLLGRLVDKHLKGIRNTVAEADSLHALQEAVSARLDEIDGSVSDFIRSETERAEKAENAASELRQQLTSMESEAEDLRTSLEAARSEATVDPLTGVANRRAYNERMEIEYARWKRRHEPLTMAIMDIDKFKRINDDFGHPAGDKVLQAVAARIQQQVRESDFFGRIGGEEFVLLLVDSDLDSSHARLEAIRTSIEACRFRFRNEMVPVTLSIGYAQFDERDNPDSVYARADAALLLCKQSGRNQCQSERAMNSD